MLQPTCSCMPEDRIDRKAQGMSQRSGQYMVGRRCLAVYERDVFSQLKFHTICEPIGSIW